jgi:uncharacterized protein (UPF0305 family)
VKSAVGLFDAKQPPVVTEIETADVADVGIFRIEHHSKDDRETRTKGDVPIDWKSLFARLMSVRILSYDLCMNIDHVEISEERLKEFMEILKEEFKYTVPREEALALAIRLVALYRVITRPLPPMVTEAPASHSAQNAPE